MPVCDSPPPSPPYSGPDLYVVIAMPIVCILAFGWITYYCLLSNGCLQACCFRPCLLANRYTYMAARKCCTTYPACGGRCCYCQCGYGCCPSMPDPADSVPIDVDTVPVVQLKRGDTFRNSNHFSLPSKLPPVATAESELIAKFRQQQQRQSKCHVDVCRCMSRKATCQS